MTIPNNNAIKDAVPAGSRAMIRAARQARTMALGGFGSDWTVLAATLAPAGVGT